MNNIISTLLTFPLAFSMSQIPGSYSHKHIKWLRKMKMRPKECKILCFLEDINIKKILILIGSWYTYPYFSKWYTSNHCSIWVWINRLKYNFGKPKSIETVTKFELSEFQSISDILHIKKVVYLWEKHFAQIDQGIGVAQFCLHF